MKRLLSLALALSLLLGTALAQDAYEEKVARARQVTNMQEAQAFVTVEGFLADAWPSFAQALGLAPVRMTPEEASAALASAYNRTGNCADTLRLWGIAPSDELPYALPGEACPPQPPREILEADTLLGELSVTVIPLQDGGWGEAGALVFTKFWGQDWQLVDYVPGEAKGVLRCGENEGALLEFALYGHGTGYYAESVSLYNPLARRVETAYTRIGHDVPLGGYGLYVSGQTMGDAMGFTVVQCLAFATDEETQGMTRYVQRAAQTVCQRYRLDADGGFSLVASGTLDNASPALLLNLADMDVPWALAVP